MADDMVVDMEVDKVAGMAADKKKRQKLANMELDMGGRHEGKKVADMVAKKNKMSSKLCKFIMICLLIFRILS